MFLLCIFVGCQNETYEKVLVVEFFKVYAQFLTYKGIFFNVDRTDTCGTKFVSKMLHVMLMSTYPCPQEKIIAP